jgi:hypothetical protein
MRVHIHERPGELNRHADGPPIEKIDTVVTRNDLDVAATVKTAIVMPPASHHWYRPNSFHSDLMTQESFGDITNC